MSPADAVSPAWLSVPPADGLPEAVAAGVGPAAQKIGFMPNVARLLAISPDHFTAWWRYFDELMRGPSGLSKTQREMIAVVVSAGARRPYCEVAHAAALRLRAKDPARSRPPRPGCYPTPDTTSLAGLQRRRAEPWH